MLAKALIADPDILLLDEPTNHMDIEAITGLEDLLLPFGRAGVHHARPPLIRRLATRIVELDRGRLISFPGDYDDYRAKAGRSSKSKRAQNANFDKFLAQEEVWIRQGIEARRTRNEGRVRARSFARRAARAPRVLGQFRAAVEVPSRSGNLVPISSTSTSATTAHGVRDSR